MEQNRFNNINPSFGLQTEQIMSLKKYKAFAAVVEKQSITKAAESLGCSQSAVSHMIRDLEEELGTKLLLRNSRQIVPTNEGSAILPYIRDMLTLDSKINQEIAELKGLRKGKIRIGAFTSVAVHWLPDIIKEFQQEHPNIEITLKNGDYHDIEEWMNHNEIDVGFITLPSSLKCKQITLADDPLLAVLSLNHPYAKEEMYPVSHVSEENFIGLLETSSHDTKRIFAQNHVTPNIKFTTKDDYAIIAMVEKGLGISILPALLLDGRSQNVITKELFPKCKRIIGVAISNTAESSNLINAFCTYLQCWVKKNHAADSGD